MKKIGIVIIFLLPLTLFSQVRENHIDVHFYPHSLSPQDSLHDGPFGKKLDIQEDAFLIWVDLFPGMFFAHETAYILVSKDSIRIEKGDWWPVLNGKAVCHNEHGKYSLVSPFELPQIYANGYFDERIDIHVYPHELTSQDQLTDGPEERLFKIEDNCLLVWVDLLPGAYFAHSTAYILISKESIRAEQGNWWPTLNGRTILYGQRNKIGIISPFKVSGSGYSVEKGNNKEEKITK